MKKCMYMLMLASALAASMPGQSAMAMEQRKKGDELNYYGTAYIYVGSSRKSGAERLSGEHGYWKKKTKKRRGARAEVVDVLTDTSISYLQAAQTVTLIYLLKDLLSEGAIVEEDDASEGYVELLPTLTKLFKNGGWDAFQKMMVNSKVKRKWILMAIQEELSGEVDVEEGFESFLTSMGIEEGMYVDPKRIEKILDGAVGAWCDAAKIKRSGGSRRRPRRSGRRTVGRRRGPRNSSNSDDSSDDSDSDDDSDGDDDTTGDRLTDIEKGFLNSLVGSRLPRSVQENLKKGCKSRLKRGEFYSATVFARYLKKTKKTAGFANAIRDILGSGIVAEVKRDIFADWQKKVRKRKIEVSFVRFLVGLANKARSCEMTAKVYVDRKYRRRR